MKYCLQIKDLITLGKLGITAEEKANFQAVKWQITLEGKKFYTACLSDDIEDTLCYESICNIVKSESLASYNLLETLSYNVFRALKLQIPSDIFLKVTATKLTPPITDLKNGVSFTISES